MRIINPKCLDHTSFLASIIISLHYCDLLPHPERFSKIKRYINNYELACNSPESFEYCNPSISLTVYDENGLIIYIPTNNTNKKAHIVKINKYRFNALKPKLPEEIKHCYVLFLFELSYCHQFYDRQNLFRKNKVKNITTCYS